MVDFAASEEPSGIVVGFDLGTVRIGVSRSDSKRVLAHPYGVIERTNDDGADAQRIARLVEELEATLVVVGLPIDLQGRRGVAAQNVEAFLDILRARLSVPVATADERMTTVIATRQRNEVNEALSSSRPRGRNGERASRRRRPTGVRRAVVDDQAATILLQGYLDAHRDTR